MTYVIEEDEKSMSGLININFMTRNVIDVAVASDAALHVKASRSPTTRFINDATIRALLIETEWAYR
jgi:hypothetical protein